MKGEHSPNVSTNESELVASVSNPWLRVSLDKLVHDPASNFLDGLVILKIPIQQKT